MYVKEISKLIAKMETVNNLAGVVIPSLPSDGCISFFSNSALQNNASWSDQIQTQSKYNLHYFSFYLKLNFYLTPLPYYGQNILIEIGKENTPHALCQSETE